MVENGLWVFGYGSLVWQPGFEFTVHQIARLDGYARSFCMRSIHHRGTVDAPGLVLALDKSEGAYCDGVAFYVEPAQAGKTLDYLRERELISSAYLEEYNTVTLAGGGDVAAVCFVIDTGHTQYCAGLPLEEQAQIISTAVGGRGSNFDYLYNTAAHLRTLGIEDQNLNWLETRVRQLVG